MIGLIFCFQDPFRDYTNFTGVEGFTFVANLVYLRASLDRSALGLTNLQTSGYVEKNIIELLKEDRYEH